MPQKNINITANVQDHLWSGVASHVDRDYKKDKNKGINPKYTKYNEMLSKDSLNQAINQHFKALVDKHDKSNSVKKNPQRAYGSVGNYLKRRKGKPESTIVLKIGKQADKSKLRAMVQGTDLMTESEAVGKVKKVHDYAFKLYVQGYKQRRHPLGKSYIPMGHAETNEDEKGGDHLHYNIADLGFTTKGNASMGFSRAICNEYHVSNRLKAMKLWHRQEDYAMLHCMNKSYQKLISPDIHFKLKRTKHPYHLEQPVYEDAMRTRNKMMKEADDAFQSLERVADSLKKENGILRIQLKQSNKVITSLRGFGKINHHKNVVISNQRKELRELTSKNQSLQKTIDQSLTIWAKRNAQLERNNRQLAKNNQIFLKSDKGVIDTLVTLLNNNKRWSQQLPELQHRLSQFKAIIPYLPKLLTILNESKPLSKDNIAKLLLDSENSKKKQNQN